jgi:hypothetical protein
MSQRRGNAQLRMISLREDMANLLCCDVEEEVDSLDKASEILRLHCGDATYIAVATDVAETWLTRVEYVI